MFADELPDTKLLTFFSKVVASNPSTSHKPYTQGEVLAFSEVKEWLAKGYSLESFNTVPTAGNDKEVTLHVFLTRNLDALSE